MFEIDTFNYMDFNWELRYDYHCLYILENGIDAYIGETKDPIKRGSQHNLKSSPRKKYNFKKIHIITGLSAEETPIKHYENLLIKLMKVDQKYNIVNGNNGETQHYVRKNEFELEFDKLWFKLEKKGLVKTKSFQSIINSNTYKYSPNTVLTEEQHKSLTSIVHTIDSEETLPHRADFKTRPILIRGDAGTGKTVVATSLFYYLRSQERYKNKKIALVYANTSTRYEIQEVFKRTEGMYKKDVISPIDVTKQHYDIIICDEAQRLRRGKNLGKYFKHFKEGNARLGFDNTHDELDWILANSDCQILFYDEKQNTTPSDIDPTYFQDRLDERRRGERPIKLNEQMRINAGKDYVPYIYDVLYEGARTMKEFVNYEFKLFNSISEMMNLLDEQESTMGLSRHSSGYAWEWNGREDKTLSDIVIDDVSIYWNGQTKGWLSNPSAIKEMGSIYTLAGLDLNYSGVVIGPDLYFDKQENMIKVNKARFFDNKVKNGITDEELKRYVLNTYAVLLTRGIRGTYVYVCDKNLREYFEQFIPYFR